MNIKMKWVNWIKVKCNYLFLPLDDVRDGVRFGRSDLTVENDRFAHHGRQVLRILHLLVTSRSCNDPIHRPLYTGWLFSIPPHRQFNTSLCTHQPLKWAVRLGDGLVRYMEVGVSVIHKLKLFHSTKSPVQHVPLQLSATKMDSTLGGRICPLYGGRCVRYMEVGPFPSHQISNSTRPFALINS